MSVVVLVVISAALVASQLNTQQHTALQQFYNDIGCTNVTSCPNDTLTNCSGVVTCFSGSLLRITIPPMTTNSTLPSSIALFTGLTSL